jgi:hypothetical protein
MFVMLTLTMSTHKLKRLIDWGGNRTRERVKSVRVRDISELEVLVLSQELD